jgi:hypothetical protein
MLDMCDHAERLLAPIYNRMWHLSGSIARWLEQKLSAKDLKNAVESWATHRDFPRFIQG